MAVFSTDLSTVQQQIRACGQIPDELIEVFREEAEAHIRIIYDGLDRLRVELNDFDALSDIRRSSHTLKGAAGAVGHEAISRLSHRMEDLLDFLFDNKQPLTNAQLELLLVTADHLQDISLGEFDFDDLSHSLLDVYHRFEQLFAAIKVSESLGEAESETLLSGLDEATEANCHNVSKGWVETEDENEERSDAESNDSVYLELVFEQLNASVDIQPEIQAIFSEEAQELLVAILQGLEKLKQNLSDQSAVSEVRRSAHTLKGAAGAVGMECIARLAHRMEDLLDTLAERRQSVTDSQLQIMLVTTDCIRELTTGTLGFVELAESIAGLYARYDREMQTCNATVASEPAIGISPSTKLGSASKPNGLKSVDYSQVDCDDDVDVAIAAAMVAAAKSKMAGAKPSEDKQPAHSGQYLRVPLERIDTLVALVGEMVVNRSAMNQRMTDFEIRIQDMQLAINRFRGIAQEMEKSFGFEAMRQNARERRMATKALASSRTSDLPVNRIAAFTRSDVRSTTNKLIHKELDTLEFDRYSQLHLLARSIAEATNDISVITNEFRNIYGDVDSLIERQQRHNRDAQNGLMKIRMLPMSSVLSRLERTVRTVSNKLGKHVDLVVVGENTELDKTVLEAITDPLLHLIRNALDHGIETSEQRKAVGKPERACLTLETLHQGTQVTLRVSDDGRGLDLAKIRNKALEQGLISDQAKPTDEELHDLIFVPGFSTAESLTEISGRGVGMDVVREAVQRLNGSIRVESCTGKGVTFNIHLPTSLSVTRALIVTSGSHAFAIPMQSVQQIVRMDMVTKEKVGAQIFVKRDDKVLRLASLAQHMDLRAAPETEEELASQPVLLIRSGDDEVALTVDSVKGGQDIVVKSLGDHLRHVPGYLGATLAGDGTVIPILDPSDLCGERVVKRTSHSYRTAETKVKRRNSVMVIDDSLSVRRVATNLLRSHGWDVVDAKDGLDALEKLGSLDTPPDIFLCDMEMPRMDGLELIETLRGMPEFAATPIIMVTSRSSEKHRRLAADAGANEHVVKPFKDDQLLLMMENLVIEYRELVPCPD